MARRAARARCSTRCRLGWRPVCKGLPSAVVNAADERSDNAIVVRAKTGWWRQRCARIEAVEAVEAIEKLLSGLLDAS